MAKSYYGTINDINGATWTVELWNSPTPAVPDTATEVVLNGCVIDYQGEHDELYENPLKSSSVTVGFTAYTAGDFSNSVQAGLIGLATDEESKWVLKINKNGSLYWVGQVLADQFQYDYTNQYGWQINITAVDCLSLVDGFFIDESWFSLSSGQRESIIVLFSSILNKTGLLGYFGSNVFADGILTTNASFPASYTLAYTTVNKYSFIDNYEERSDKIKYISCKAALEQLLDIFRPAKAWLCNGLYYFTQPNAYASGAFTIDYYSSAGAINSSSSFVDYVSILTASPLTRPILEATPVGSNLKPIRAVEIDWIRSNYQVESRTTASSATFSKSFTDITTGSTLPGHLLKGTFKINIGISSGITRFRVRTLICAKSGANYYWWDGTTAAWINNGATISGLQVVSDYFQSLVPGGYNYVSEYEIAEPPSGYSLYMQVEVDEQRGVLSRSGSFVTWAAAANTPSAFTGIMTLQQAYNTTSPSEYKQDRQYVNTLPSPRDINSTRLVLNSKYYDSYSREVGGLQVWNGASYVDPGSWSTTFHSETGEINKVSCTSITGLHANFLQTLEGKLHDAGNYTPVKSLSYDSYFWYFNGGKHDIYNGTFDGTWIAIGVNYALHSSTGEGELIALPKNRDGEKQIEVLKSQMAVVYKNLGGIFSDLPIEIINVSPSGPTVDPGVDKTYFVQIKYTYDPTYPTVGWEITEGSAGGATNLAYVAAPVAGTVTSDTGTDATLTAADVTNAGLLLPADFNKLQALQSAAYKSEEYFIALAIVL